MQVMDVGNVGSGTMDLQAQRALVPRAWFGAQQDSYAIEKRLRDSWVKNSSDDSHEERRNRKCWIDDRLA